MHQYISADGKVNKFQRVIVAKLSCAGITANVPLHSTSRVVPDTNSREPKRHEDTADNPSDHASQIHPPFHAHSPPIQT